MKKLILALALSFCAVSQAEAYDDFHFTNYGFATVGGGFYVDETGYMTLAETLETKRLFVNGRPINEIGDDLVASKKLYLDSGGSTRHVLGAASVGLLSKTVPVGGEIRLIFDGNASIVHGMPSDASWAGMLLEGSISTSGPILIDFMMDKNGYFREISRKKY